MKNLGIITIVLLCTAGLVGAGWLIDHLLEDHRNYHSNAQLLELVRQAVLEKHPELGDQ